MDKGPAVAIIVGVLALIGLLCWLFIPHETVAKVTFITWNYRADLRQRTLKHDSGWGSPFGAFNVSCQRRYYGEEDCNPHPCGTGFHLDFNTDSRDTCYAHCSVYKDWCEYDYYDWPIIRTERTSGVAHDEHWPELAAGPEQRVDRTEEYKVDFVGDTDWSYSPNNLGDFRRFLPKEMWKIKVNNAKMVTPLQVLRPEAEYQ